jgi:DNA-binding response OmpR family regulator
MRILLVEDNPGDAFITKRTLRTHDVRWAKSLGDALPAIPTFLPDVVVLDLGLPDSQGIETFRRMRDAYPDGPVVVLTGNANDRIRDGVMALGAAGVLTKTVDGRAEVPALLERLTVPKG